MSYASMRTIREQAAAVAAGEIPPAELTGRALDAIARTQPSLNAFTAVLGDDARARAGAGVPPGPLHGVPVAVKDLYDVAGAPTTGCCAVYHDRIASSDAVVVERLRAAGAIVVAKTNQHELADGGTNQASSFGPAWNPWGAKRLTGGSSGGSAAAVAAGVVAMALGSDTLGSIRIPSSWCGTTGLKTTHGSVSMRGAMPFIASLDTAGPIASDAIDCALVFTVLADDAARHERARALRDPPRITLFTAWLKHCATDTREAVEDVARTLAATGVVVDRIDGVDVDAAWAALLPAWAEFAHAYPDLWEEDRVSEETAFMLRFGRRFTDDEVAEAARGRARARSEFDAVFREYDAALAPATPYPAPLAGQDVVEVEDGVLDVRAGCARYTAPVNAAGLPSLAFPAGISREGLPLGAQLIGPAFAELRLCDLGARYQRESGWHLRTPG